jgi:hypothetical protein
MTVRRLRQLRIHAGRIVRFARLFALPLALVTIVVHALNAALWSGPGPYVAALLITLANSSGMFLLLLYRFFPLKGE